MSFANAQVLGRLVADPELVNYGNEGKHLARFRIAANVRKDKAVFYNGIAFNQQADVMGKYLKKGSQVFLEGYFQNNDYEKDVNGTPVKMYTLEFVVNNVVFVGGNDNQQQGSRPATQSYGQQPQQQSAPNTQNQANTNPFGGFDISADDLPF